MSQRILKTLQGLKEYFCGVRVSRFPHAVCGPTPKKGRKTKNRPKCMWDDSQTLWWYRGETSDCQLATEANCQPRLSTTKSSCTKLKPLARMQLSRSNLRYLVSDLFQQVDISMCGHLRIDSWCGPVTTAQCLPMLYVCRHVWTFADCVQYLLWCWTKTEKNASLLVRYRAS